MDKIRDFLEREMKKRGWRQADLARAANLDSAVISNIINGRRGLGEETGKYIANALDVPAEVVFRAAGILPTKSKSDEKVEELEYLFSRLDEDEQQQVIKFARFLSSLRGENSDDAKNSGLAQPG